MHLASIGIDLGKTTFHLVALGERNKILLRRNFSRSQLLAYTANLPASLIGLEERAGAHFMGAASRTRTTSSMRKRLLRATKSWLRSRTSWLFARVQKRGWRNSSGRRFLWHDLAPVSQILFVLFPRRLTMNHASFKRLPDAILGPGVSHSRCDRTWFLPLPCLVNLADSRRRHHPCRH